MDEDEQAFLAAILEAPLDNAVRLIFADWLDDHNRPIHADYLRVECHMMQYQPQDIRYKLKRAYLVTIGKGIDREWIALISRVQIDNCPNMLNANSHCPKRWEGLKHTESELIRECENCRRSVYFCSEALDVDQMKRQGETIVIDPRLQYGGATPRPRNTRASRPRRRRD